jgi:hypothetical protein
MREKYVYAITDGTNIKIGVANNPLQRIKSLSTGNANKLRLLGYFPGGFELERELHQRFRKVRENGEWLYSTNELVEYLNEKIHDKLIVLENNQIKSYMKILNVKLIS